ncbi:ribonuclease HII [Cryobacterium mesophilum]|uniref:Ribonuclease n=1 Tax=Terrimesophilobacter mesophilus TaxID=433647 RepID=A0A4R8VBV2_9MICO|nr:ribonuclease HII [Terrimesophilobacter mesophilus]MBB5632491.1 ribonuclease HII [Terrimesophilobacter mesophilus]TFB79317.1 ribonuclease HII [Terrimesophilobacter mesophilus]
MAVADPTLQLEFELLAGGAHYVIGCDEVGRGAIAGPVAVGMCAIDANVGSFPPGLRDSKMLSEKRREELAPRAAEWAVHSAVGLASAEEVDRLGITACLGLAGKRALAALYEGGIRVLESVVLLDGQQDWLNPALTAKLAVQTRVKADRDCASVAAASVIAKVHRDGLMIQAGEREPGYGWSGNKGYGAAAHFAAIEELGTSSLHRLSWLKPRAVLSETA